MDVAHWDYQRTLSLAAAISIDRESVLEACRLAPESQLAVAVTARSDLTNVCGLLTRVDVPAQARHDLAIEADLPGHSLGGALELVTHVVVSHPIPLGALSPHRPGSILWRTRHRAHLEGSASRFPTDATDFRKTRPEHAHAGWHVHLDTTEHDAAFMSAVRVTLNTAHKRIRDSLAGTENPETTQLLMTLKWDVTRQLALQALLWDEIDDSPPDFESTTVTAVLRSLLAQIWPYDTPSALRQRWVQNPELIELQIQHYVRPFID